MVPLFYNTHVQIHFIFSPELNEIPIRNILDSPTLFSGRVILVSSKTLDILPTLDCRRPWIVGAPSELSGDLELYIST